VDTDRRTFVKTTAGIAIGAAGFAPALATARPRQLDRIGVQLYTVRRAMAEDFDATLARIAAIGYNEVEFAGYFDREPAAVREALDAVGLAAPAAHVGYDTLLDGWDQVLETATSVGHAYVICPSLPRSVRETLDGYREAAEVFNRAAEQAQAAGLQFGFHNHAVEFEPLDGQVPYDVLLAETDPQFVTYELDLFWATRAGADPLEYFAEHPGRFSLVHVKDMDGTPERGMADVGAGVMDFAAMFAQRDRAGIRHFFVEHDNPTDAFASIRASYEYLAHLTF
jgi:sugar phosphate isomerase/epimerase